MIPYTCPGCLFIYRKLDVIRDGVMCAIYGTSILDFKKTSPEDDAADRLGGRDAVLARNPTPTWSAKR